jgi:hypothetical protein
MREVQLAAKEGPAWLTRLPGIRKGLSSGIQGSKSLLPMVSLIHRKTHTHIEGTFNKHLMKP